MKKSKVAVIALILAFITMASIFIAQYDGGDNGEGGAGRKNADQRPQTAPDREDAPEKPGKDQVEQFSLPEIPETSEQDDEEFIEFLLAAPRDNVRKLVEQCYKEGTDEERWSLYARLREAFIHTDDLERRRLLIEYLLVGVKNDEKWRDYILRRAFKANILRLYEEDFSARAREILAGVIDSHGFEYTTVLLTGIADMERYYPEYRKMANQHLNGERNGHVSWAAVLVIARRGKEEAREKFARGACREVKKRNCWR